VSDQFLQSDFQGGDPLRKVANARQQNRIATILNTIQGWGCRVVRNYSAEGRGWYIVVDGTSDQPIPDSFAPYVSSPASKFAVDSADAPDYGNNQFSLPGTYDSSADIVVTHAINTAGTRTIRFFVEVGTGTPTHVLGKTSTGTLCWVTLTDTCG